MTEATFRRYTNLASAIHILRTSRITLLSPSTWEDKNDAHFMAEYKRQKGAASVLALCFADHHETYHHWRVFAPGSDGVCIEFDRSRLLASFSDARVRHKAVDYVTLDAVGRMTTVELEDLPFMKRFPFRPEGEYRIVFVDDVDEHATFDVPVDLACVTHITLSPWMATPLASSVKETLKELRDASSIPIHQSTLIKNDDWQALTTRTKGVTS